LWYEERALILKMSFGDAFIIRTGNFTVNVEYRKFVKGVKKRKTIRQRFDYQNAIWLDINLTNFFLSYEMY
jgi:hypothetical protein